MVTVAVIKQFVTQWLGSQAPRLIRWQSKLEDGKAVAEVPLSGPGLMERTFKDCDDYTTHMLRPDGSTSAACEFAVCDLELRLPEGSVSLSKEWRVEFKGENIPIAAVYLFNEGDSYGRHPIVLSAEERHAGSVSIPAELLKKPGKCKCG